jgi:hypothetical protein
VAPSLKSVTGLHETGRVERDDGQFVHDAEAARDFPDVRKMSIPRRPTRLSTNYLAAPALPLCPCLPLTRTFSLIPRPEDRW